MLRASSARLSSGRFEPKPRTAAQANSALVATPTRCEGQSYIWVYIFIYIYIPLVDVTRKFSAFVQWKIRAKAADSSAGELGLGRDAHQV